LGKALVRWVVDVYHNEAHAGLGGETPNDAWARLSEEYQVRPPPSPAMIRAVFGFNDLRQIQNRGIRFMGLFYRRSADNRLAKLRQRIGQKKVRIRADLRNLGAISVCADEAGATWFTVHCDFNWMEGVSANEWLATVNRTRQRHADLAKLREPVVLAALQDIQARIAPVFVPLIMTCRLSRPRRSPRAHPAVGAAASPAGAPGSLADRDGFPGDGGKRRTQAGNGAAGYL
ncbi:MAG: Transposase-like Mu, partial [Microvirga sp.]|nr:Transposase-like Mu [Microvirga sp.]